MNDAICRLLVSKGELSEAQATDALKAHGEEAAQRFDQMLVKQNLVPEAAVLQAMAEVMALRYVELADSDVDDAALQAVPARLVYRYGVFPVARHNGTITVATSDPLNSPALDELRISTQLKVDPVLATRADIDRMIKRHFGVGGETVGQLINGRENELNAAGDEDGDDLAEEASVVRLVNEILAEAIRERASDVHIEPQETGLHIRYRVDGVLRQQSLPPELHRFRSAMVSRLKIMARLNIAEKRLPQDGRIKLRVEGRDVDVRVSIIPMVHGEGVVLRILDRGGALLTLEQIGMDSDTHARFSKLIHLPHGIILVTGPTGSGKSTTLYSGLCEINDESIKITTVEDPVEYQMAGVSQIQVQPKIGLTFAACLRSILRHDPDVVLVGEIRDRETAEIAMQASMTGHLVFSTLHTNDAASSARLTDMGVEPYLVASSIEAILAQRLVRTICSECKTTYVPRSDSLPPDFPTIPGRVLHRGQGCRACRNTGYVGRSGIYELLIPNAAIRQMTMDRANASDILAEAVRGGMTTLRQSGYRKVLEGITTIDEVMRVTKADESAAPPKRAPLRYGTLLDEFGPRDSGTLRLA